MENFNLNLVNKDGATISTSVELSNKAFASEYFGTWFKKDATLSDVASWCEEQIKTHRRLINNFKTLMAKSRVMMFEGLGLEEMESIVAQKKKANEAPAEA